MRRRISERGGTYDFGFARSRRGCHVPLGKHHERYAAKDRAAGKFLPKKAMKFLRAIWNWFADNLVEEDAMKETFSYKDASITINASLLRSATVDITIGQYTELNLSPEEFLQRVYPALESYAAAGSVAAIKDTDPAPPPAAQSSASSAPSGQTSIASAFAPTPIEQVAPTALTDAEWLERAAYAINRDKKEGEPNDPVPTFFTDEAWVKMNSGNGRYMWQEGDLDREKTRERIKADGHAIEGL